MIIEPDVKGSLARTTLTGCTFVSTLSLVMRFFDAALASLRSAFIAEFLLYGPALRGNFTSLIIACERVDGLLFIGISVCVLECHAFEVCDEVEIVSLIESI